MLFRGSAETVERTLTIIGAVVVLCAVVAGFLVVTNPFGGRPAGQISVAINTPYVGEGVADGTAIVMHGVEVGKVTQMNSVPGGGVQLLTDLQKTPLAGLTDTMSIDFRPINYFGVTGINIVAGPGGQPLRDGMQINLTPKSNSTLQALLSRLGDVTAGAVTPQLISVIDRTVRYTDALTPLIETILVALDAVARVQTVSTARLLANATGTAVAFPGFVDAITDAGYNFLYPSRFGAQSDDYFYTRTRETINEGSTGIFGGTGRILVKFVDDLLPAVDAIKLLTDPVPVLFRPAEVSHTLVELRTRFEKMYAGTPEQRALQVRIVLDSIPGVAAPLGMAGAPE